MRTARAESEKDKVKGVRPFFFILLSLGARRVKKKGAAHFCQLPELVRPSRGNETYFRKARRLPAKFSCRPVPRKNMAKAGGLRKQPCKRNF